MGLRVFIFICFLVFTSCNNRNSTPSLPYSQFDSIRNELSKVQQQVNIQSDSVYEQLINKLTDETGGVRQFYYQVHDFYGYIRNLQYRLQTAAGDTGQGISPVQSSDKEITRKFFEDSKNTSDYLLTSLRFTFDQLRQFAQIDSLRESINAFETASLGNLDSTRQLYEVYFKEAGPAKAITILNSFEQRVRQFELLILTRHYNNYINELKEKILGNGNRDRDTLQQ